MTPHPLEARSITRRNSAGGRPLLDSVSLAIGDGECLAVAGASGAGKTLLLRALAVLDEVDGGSLLWQGNTVADDEVPRFRSQVMYLNQRAAVFDGTVEDNLQAPYQLAAHHHKHYDVALIVNWLARLGRDNGFLQKRAADLSGGEAQITAMLRVLQLNPRIILADEPTSAMDTATARGAEQLFLDWLKDNLGEQGESEASESSQIGRALVWVSHDVKQARRMATRLILMERGEVIHQMDDNSEWRPEP